MRAARGCWDLRSNSEAVPRSESSSSIARLRRSAMRWFLLHRGQAARDEIQSAARDEAQRNARTGPVLKLRNEIRRADVQRDTGRDGETICAKKGPVIGQYHSGDGHRAQGRGGEDRLTPTGACRQE